MKKSSASCVSDVHFTKQDDMLYMVIERFRNGDARPVYERFREHGRLMPEGVEYIDSWVNADLKQCFQLMRTADIALLHQWGANWSDLVDFEFVPVITSKEAAARV
jgi:hypothetical protein